MSHVTTHWTVWSHIHWSSGSHWSTRSHRSIVTTHVSSRTHSHRSSWSHWTSGPHWSTRSHRSTGSHWSIVSSHMSSRTHSHRSSWSHWTSGPHAGSHHSIRSSHHVAIHHGSIRSTRTHIHRTIGSHWSSRSHHRTSPGVHHTATHGSHPPGSVIEWIVGEDRVSHHVQVPGQRLVHRDGRVLTGSPLLLGVPALVAASSTSYWALEPSRHVSRWLRWVRPHLGTVSDVSSEILTEFPASDIRHQAWRWVRAVLAVLAVLAGVSLSVYTWPGCWLPIQDGRTVGAV